MVYFHRLSLFKLPDEAQQEEFVSQYRNVKDIAEKVSGTIFCAHGVSQSFPCPSADKAFLNASLFVSPAV